MSSVPSAVKAFDFPSCTFVNLRVPVVDEAFDKTSNTNCPLAGVILKDSAFLQWACDPSWLKP